MPRMPGGDPKNGPARTRREGGKLILVSLKKLIAGFVQGRLIACGAAAGRSLSATMHRGRSPAELVRMVDIAGVRRKS
jgi:hypothetical protein